MEFGISTFGEIVADNVAGGAKNAAKRMHGLVEEARLADDIGLDVFALGEHHRKDYVVSAPEVALAGIATVTKNIRLSSAVTVLSSADPVRTFQNFATLDLLSGGRAEIMAGRGSFIESFPLFGYSLEDYDTLFTEKLDMLLAINRNETVTWKGQHRAAVNGLGVYPRPLQEQLPVWIAVGGTPASVIRAAKLNLPLVIAILGGAPEQFAQLTDLYRKVAEEAGHEIDKLQLAINEHVYIAETSQQAADEFWPVYEKLMNKIGKERGWGAITRSYYEHIRGPKGPLMVGSAAEVAEKLVYQYGLFKNTRFLAQTIIGEDLPHEKLLYSIELFGNKVVPAVRKALETE